jgi:polysaccharide pyruvyl transferase WcaK-like protein
VGAGPVDSRLGRRFIRWTLALSCYRSYRDERSRKLALEIGAPGEHIYVPDLAFSLSILPARLSRQASRPVVGINPLPFFDRWYWYKSDDRLYREYVSKLAELAELVIDNGYAVWLFPTQLRADPAVIDDVRCAMREGYRSYLIKWPVQSFDDLTAGIKGCRLIIATRYHGILLSLLLEKPVLALAYHGKSQDLMALLGQSKYALDAAAWNLDTVSHLFFEIERERNQVTEQIASRLPAIRRALANQYDVLIGYDLPKRENAPTEQLEVRSSSSWN